MHRILLQIFFLVMIAYGHSQDFEWAIGFGDWTDDGVVTTAVDPKGNVLVTGRLTSGTVIGDTTFNSQGVYLAKFDESGNYKWARRFSTFSSLGIDISFDSQSNVYLVGYYQTFNHEGFNLQGGTQPRTFVMKLDEDGNLIWVEGFGTVNTSGTTIPTAINVDAEGNVYFSCYFNGLIEISGTSYDVVGREVFDHDILLIKLSTDGEVLFVQTAGSTSEDSFTDMEVGADGIYVVGSSGGRELEIGSLTYERPEEYYGFIAKYSFEGDLNWIKPINVATRSNLMRMDLDDFGNIILATYWTDTDDYRDHQISIVKYDATGSLIFKRPLIQSYDVRSSFWFKSWDIASNGSDIYFITGVGNLVIDRFNIESNGYSDVIVSKFNDIGYPQWISQVDGDLTESGVSITVGDNRVYVAGEYNSSELTFGDHTITNNSGNQDVDVFLSGLSDATSNICPEQEDFFISYPEIICEGDSIRLSVDNEYAVFTEWYRDGQLLDFSNKTEVYIREPGTYTIEVNTNTTCELAPLTLQIDSESQSNEFSEVIINEKPIADIEVNETICAGESINFSSPFNVDYDYYWTIQRTETSYEREENETTVLWSRSFEDITAILEVTDLATGCTNSDTLFFDVGFTPETNLSVSGNTISTEVNGPADFYRWFHEGIELKDKENQEFITVSSIGNYYVEISNQFGCSFTSDSIFIDSVLGSPELLDLNYYPNPFQEQLTIEVFEPIEKMEIADISGKVLKHLDINKTSFYLGDLPSGILILLIQKVQGTHQSIILKKN